MVAYAYLVIINSLGVILLLLKCYIISIHLFYIVEIKPFQLFIVIVTMMALM